MNQYIAVFDAGKTNKKLIIYDDSLNVVEVSKATFEEYVDNGIHFEAIDETIAWLKNQLKKAAKTYAIKAISIATHGATIVCVGSDNTLSVPLVAYTTEPGKAFHDRFYAEFGDPVELQKETATPNFGSLICVAKNIYYLKNIYSDGFRNTTHILNFPQFFGFILTGNYGMEPTYIGSHTNLWDFDNKKWSHVAEKLGIISMLPEKLSNSWDVLGTVTPSIAEETGLGLDTIVTMGIHDSNSSLLPYIIKSTEDFVLNSTGTWCVAMRPAEKVEFNEQDLGKIVYFNLNPFNRPIKTAIFMGGLEFETYDTILKKTHGNKPYPGFNRDLALTIIKEKELFILPSVVRGTGQFPDSPPLVLEKGIKYQFKDIEQGTQIPGFFHDYEVSLAVLNMSIAIQTRVALDRIGAQNSKQIFIEGGFRQNTFYNSLLSALYPNTEIVLTNLKEATAFGAALLGKAALDKINPMKLKNSFSLDLTPVEPVRLPGLQEYINTFFRHMNL